MKSLPTLGIRSEAEQLLTATFPGCWIEQDRVAGATGGAHNSALAVTLALWAY